jgi:hypothetical protein
MSKIPLKNRQSIILRDDRRTSVRSIEDLRGLDKTTISRQRTREIRPSVILALESNTISENLHKPLG